MDPSKIHWLAVALAAVSAFLVGGLWYSPLLFGKPWARLVGLTDAQQGQGVARVFGGAFVCAAIASVNLAFFIGDAGGVAFGTMAGFAAGLGWVATGLTTTMLFERRPGALIAIDAGYHVVALTLMGFILGAWK
jgi:hypothetical protein